MKEQLQSFKLGFKTIPVQFISGFISTPHNPTEKFRLKGEFGSEEIVELERKDRVQFYFCYDSNYEDLITLKASNVDFKSGENVSIIELGDTFWFFGKRTAFYKAVVIGNSSRTFHYVTDSLELTKSLFKIELVDYLLALFCCAMAIWAGYELSLYVGNAYVGFVGGFIVLFLWAWNIIQLNKVLNKLIWEPLAISYEGQLRKEISKFVNSILDSNKTK
jgi:hypothetical protein